MFILLLASVLFYVLYMTVAHKRRQALQTAEANRRRHMNRRG